MTREQKIKLLRLLKKIYEDLNSGYIAEESKAADRNRANLEVDVLAMMVEIGEIK